MSAVLHLHSALPFHSNFCSSLPISNFSRFPQHQPMQIRSGFLKGKHCLLWMPKTLNFLSTLRLWHTAMRASVLGCVKLGRPISPVGGFFWNLSIPQAWEHTTRTKISLPSNAGSLSLSIRVLSFCTTASAAAAAAACETFASPQGRFVKVGNGLITLKCTPSIDKHRFWRCAVVKAGA